MSEVKQQVKAAFAEVFEMFDVPLPELSDDLILLESGLDSIGFAAIVSLLDEQHNYDPFSKMSEAFYPITFQDFVTVYERGVS